ncbi:enoyl-CoA hydratase-related protein [Arenibaculum pallidiluteum]|uniref:enoyl-CoA hydratase-related protein n=1 Tax=Arenibaculum pallidiluteum TaxID=2812559 RepID=UPI001A97D2FF|nr:enoyl-CoA hydratase-related protein [Arenibaculum pallidiluteum]
MSAAADEADPGAEPVLIERPEEGIAVLRLNRPAARNALDMRTRHLLAEHFRDLRADASVRCVVVTGGNACFAAGADLREIAEAGPVEMIQRNTQLLWQAIAEFPRPVIAAVEGFALGGGCELAMHADIIVAGEGASFGQPEIRVGIMPGAGGTQRLVRAVGKYKAMLMVLTGKPVGAREAEAMGLVSVLAPQGEALASALDLARGIVRQPPLAVEQIKETMLAGMDAPLGAALALERKAFQLLFASEDKKEGVRAFLEKRRPVFKGR